MKSLTLANTPRGYIHSPLGQTENGEDLGLSDIDLDVIYDTTASANRESTVKSSPNSFNMRQQRLLINPDPNRRENTCMGWLTQFRKQNPMFYRVTCIILGIIFGLLVVRLIKSSSHNMKHHNNSSSSDFIEDSTSSWTDFQATSPGLGVVATDSATCSQVGVNLLILGGNAVDAAVASALCLGVVSPGSSGMGGGAFILFHNATSKLVEFIDSRETAPAASTSDMFDTEPKLSQDGGLAVGTLAELKGLYQLQRNHGALEWADCTEPAAILAEDYVVSAELANMLSDSDVMPYLFSGDYPEFSKLFLNPDGSVKKELDHVYNTKLSETLRMIGLHGSDYLYKTMAATLASEIQAVGGILQESDIQNYSFVESQPITASIMGHTLYSASGSSSGGAAVAGIAEFMDGFAEPLASEGLVYNHRLVEACKNAFAIRMSLADPAFVNTTGPIAALTSKTYMNALREDMNDAHVLPLYDYGGEYNLDKVRRFLPEDHGTSHLSVIDKHGNAVALTSTVNTYFGSKIVSASTGIVFNNQMDDFSNSHTANFFGLHPSSLNRPAPFKRPLSSMSPSILLNSSGKVRLVGGASGGPRIITATAQVILNYLGRGFDILASVKAPRLHSQLLPETVFVEQKHLISGLNILTEPDVSESLENKGHNITEWSKSMGVTQFIAVDEDTGFMIGVSDPRKNGRPQGVQSL